MQADARAMNEMLANSIDNIGRTAGTDRAATVAALSELPQSTINQIAALVRAHGERGKDRQLSAMQSEITSMRQRLTAMSEPTFTCSDGTRFTASQIAEMGHKLDPKIERELPRAARANLNLLSGRFSNQRTRGQALADLLRRK